MRVSQRNFIRLGQAITVALATMYWPSHAQKAQIISFPATQKPPAPTQDAILEPAPEPSVDHQLIVAAFEPMPLDARQATAQMAMRFAYDERLHSVSLDVVDFQKLFLALVRAESYFDVNALSEDGAIGLTQLTPDTAAELNVDPYDMEQNLKGGAEYLLRQFERFKNIKHALAAYNAGPGAVEKYQGVPPYPETEKYLQRVEAEAPEIFRPKAPKAEVINREKSNTTFIIQLHERGV